MRSHATARRSFLRGVGASLGLRSLLRSVEAAAAGGATPLRLVLIHRPNGTVRSQWLPQGGETGFALSPILKPFEPVRASMVVLDGQKAVQVGGGAQHENGMATMLTASPCGGETGGANDAIATAPSVDQVLLARSPALQGAPFKSLQLTASRKTFNPVVANTAAGYTGPGGPLYPEMDALAVYRRVFGSFMPVADPRKLERAHARQKSVLDFVRGDLARLTALAPAGQRDKLEAHAAAVRELEKSLDASLAATASCGTPQAPPGMATIAGNHAAIGKAHFELVRAAFACDLVRVVSFQWAPGVSTETFEGLFPGMPLVEHHVASHHESIPPPYDKDPERVLAAIDTWYSEQTAAFIAGLRDTAEGAGSVLDNTLVIYFSELERGVDHIRDRMPLLLFGGAGVRLRGNRFITRPDTTTNDLWLAVARVYGVDMKSLGAPEQFTGPLQGVFD